MVKISTLALLLALAGTASADDKLDLCKSKLEPAKITSHTEVINGRTVTMIDTKIEVCGHPPKPALAFVDRPKDIDYAWESLEQLFTPRILASVKKAPL